MKTCVTSFSDVVDPQDAVRVVQLLPENPTSWLAAGVALYRAGDPANAMERLIRSASLDPGNSLKLLKFRYKRRLWRNMKHLFWLTIIQVCLCCNVEPG